MISKKNIVLLHTLSAYNSLLVCSNVNEVIKAILDFFIQKNSFLNSPKKLVFVRMYESTIIGLVGPPYPCCMLVAFCAFAWLRLCAFGAFGAFGTFSAFGARKIFQ